LLVEHETLPGGELALIRLVGRSPGPAGTATLQLGDGFMLITDAAEPDQIVEILLRAPVEPAATKLLALLVGEAGSAANVLGSAGTTIDVAATPDLATAGRLAVLYLVRDAMPVPTHRGIWAIEAAALAASVASRLCGEHALAELTAARPDLEALQRQFPDAPALARLVADLAQDAVDIGRLCDALESLRAWFGRPGGQPETDPLPSRTPVAGEGSVGWDRVRPGPVDPREGALEWSVVGDDVRRYIALRLLAQQGSASYHETALFARVFDRSGQHELQSVPLALDATGTSYRGTAILPAGAGPGPFVIDISDEPDDDPAPTEELARRNHARREAFRALFLERRAARDAALADSAASRWQEAAREYERLGATDLAALARQRAIARTAPHTAPFLAELSVPVDLMGGPDHMPHDTPVARRPSA
jgi:hypothetical protein